MGFVMPAGDPPPLHVIPRADALVVLSGGFPWRELFAIRLYRSGKAPVLLCSGRLSTRTEAILMELLQLTGIPSAQVLIESRSRNTAEGGQAFRTMAASRGWRSALLVSSAYHVPRALRHYRMPSLRLTAVPCPEPSLQRIAAMRGSRPIPWDQRLTNWVPHPNGLQLTYLAMRELIAHAAGR
jgi:uncharacterized SAM-binding protein YcdF (DUF218 family)